MFHQHRVFYQPKFLNQRNANENSLVRMLNRSERRRRRS
jgi:hypothetical protein